MDRLAKYLNIVIGLGFIVVVVVGVEEVIRANPYPGVVFQIMGLLLFLGMFMFMGVINLIIAAKEFKVYEYKGKDYFLISEGLEKDPQTRKWKKVVIYKAEGTDIRFVRDGVEFYERFKKK